MITGGDADFCADDTTTGTSNDNTTQNNLITSNNNTLTNLKANLTTFNNFTGVWNWFANITADQGNFTRDIFVAGVAVYARLNGNNQTLLDLITGNNNTLGSRIAGNNQTLTDRIDGNNNTIYGSLGTKINLTASSSVQCSSGEYLGNATLLGGLITVSKCFNQTGSSDNTTQADAINTKANLTDLTNANNTIYGSLGTKVNITDAASNNNTIYGSLGTKVNLTASSSRQCTSGEYIGNVTTLGGIITSVICFNQTAADDNTTQAALLGQKLNLTGGTLSGLLTIGNISAVNNLSLNVSGALYVNSSSRYVGIGTNSPTAGLQINTSNPALRTNGSVFIDGNVGIGTTTPTALLTVAAANATNNLSLNISGRILFNTRTNVFNVTTGISCGMINGGTDTDFCVDATAGTSDNTTLTNLITGNNNTLLGLIGTKSNLTDITSMNNTLTAWLGTKANLTDITSMNNTLTAGLGTKANLTDLTNANNTIYGSLGTKANLTDLANANNTIYGSLGTKANLTDLTNANNTIYGSLGQKVNLTASSSRQCTSGEYIGNVTTLGGVITSVICYNQTASNDNTTQNDLITGNNNTLYAQLGQKLNLTGGTLSG